MNGLIGSWFIEIRRAGESFGIEDKRLRVEDELSNPGIGNQKSGIQTEKLEIGKIIKGLQSS